MASDREPSQPVSVPRAEQAAREFAEEALAQLRGVRFIGRRVVVPRAARSPGSRRLEEALALLADRLTRLERAVKELRESNEEARRRAASMDAAGASAPH